MKRLVGITGFKGSGKTTAALILEQQGYRRFSFADPIKRMLLGLGLTNDEVYGSFKERPSKLLLGQTPRLAMQTLGTEWGRELIHPHIWISVAKLDILKWLGISKDHKAVIDDMRFLNEAEMLQEIGAFLVRVDRPGVEGTDHASETEIPAINCDLYLNNFKDKKYLASLINQSYIMRDPNDDNRRSNQGQHITS